MLEIRNAIGKQLRCQHCAVSHAVGNNAVLLQPAQVKHRIVRDVSARCSKKVPYLLPPLLIQFPAVNNNNGAVAGTDLQQPQPTNNRL